MKSRCENPDDIGFVDYGMRGIEVRFRDAQELIDHIGLPPPGYCIDRVDNDGHYERGNVRWVDYATNNANRRSWAGSRARNFTESTVLAIISLARAGLTYKQIALMFGVKPKRINAILNGWAWSWLTGITPRKKTV